MDIPYMAKGGAWTTVRFFITTATSLAAMVAFGNLLPKETYGIYSYLMSLSGSLGFLTLAGIGTGIVRAVARGQENVVPYSLKLQLRYNLLATTAIAGIGFYYAYQGNFTFAVSLWILSAVMPVSTAYHSFESIFIGQKRFDVLAMTTSISAIIAAIAAVAALLFTDNVVILMSVYGFFSLVPSFLSYRYASRFISDRSEPKSETISELRRTSFHLTYAGVIGTVAQYLDKLILFQIAGPAALAVYGFAIAGPERLKALVKNVVSVILPRFAEENFEKASRFPLSRVFGSIGLGLAIAVAYISLTPLIFRLLLPQYLDAIPYSQIYAIALAAIPLTIYVGNIFAGQNMLRAIYLHSISGYVTRIVLLIILGPLWQMWGIVIASVTSYTLTAIYGVVILGVEKRRLRKKNEQRI